MSLRGKSVRTRNHNGRLRKSPTEIVKWNGHTDVWVGSGTVIRHWTLVRLFL